MIEDRQRDRLEDHGLSERAIDDQDGRAREVAVAFGVSPDVTAELIPAQELQSGPISDACPVQEVELGVTESELGERLYQPPGPGHDAITPPDRQVPGEHLEDRASMCNAALQRAAEHGQLIVVS